MLIEKIHLSEKAVSSVVSVIIVLALTITSISVILLYATPTMRSMEDMATAQRTEQAFTVFDSRASKVALGESPSQTTSFSIMNGEINVNGDDRYYQDSQIVVVCAQLNNSAWHTNFDKNRYKWNSWEGYQTQSDIIVFNSSMGSISYNHGNRVIGYEGGGVWSKYPTGKAVMISPPEFHYNGETLTLPIMQIIGNDSFSGRTDVAVTVRSDNMPAVLYPDNVHRINPLTSDKVLIYIKSEFYTAWADYADSLTYASARTDDANKTAVVELHVLPSMGTMPMGSFFKIGALNQSDAPLHKFSFDLESFAQAGGGGQSSQRLHNLNYDIVAVSGDKTLKYNLHSKGHNIELEILYQDGNREELWKKSGAFSVVGGAGPGAIQSADIDLLSKSVEMEYDSNEPSFSWDNLDISKGNENSTQSLYNITQHYMKLITMDGSIIFNCHQATGNKNNQGNPNSGNDPINYDASTITLDYDGMPGSITYLHVSRNDLSVALS